MGESEIIDWLRDCRLQGDDRYFTRKEVEVVMRERGVSVLSCRRQLNRLYYFGFLDIRLNNFWNRSYRLKKKYVVGKGS